MIQPNTDRLGPAAAPTRDGPNAPGRSFRANGALDPTERTELARLVRQAQAGDSVAQVELVRRYTRRIAGQVRLIVRQLEDVEDVTQIVFAKMFRRLARLRDPGCFEPWLFRLSRNTALDFLRRRQCRPVTVPTDPEFLQIPDPGSTHRTHEIMDALGAALEHINPKDRELITLFVQGNTYHSLAQRHGLTLGAVKARLHRVRPYLRSFVGNATATRIAGANRWGLPARAGVAA